jgi:hypothetical protein
MSEEINAHKKMAMGITEGNKMKKGGKVKHFAEGGKVMSEAKSVGRLMDSSRKEPLPKPTGKIATLKKGGAVPKRGLGVTIAVAIPVKKPRGR